MLPKKREPTHPGEMLVEEFLKPLGITQEQFATHLGGAWTQPKLSAIITKKRRITEAIALDFSDALKTSPEFWLDLQTRYDLWHAMQNRSAIQPLPQIDAAA